MNKLNLSEKNKKNLDSFVEEIKVAYRDNLVSLVLYGSAASGEFVDQNSDLNVLVVLKDDGLFNLRISRPIVGKLNYNRIRPLFMSEEYILSSLDVFPIEFLDMKENYALLFGKDVLKDIKIDIKNLRFQCEQELKSKLINLKQQYLKIDLRDKIALGNLLFRNFTSIIHILRNLVRLKGKAPAYLKEDILRDVAMELQVSITTFIKVLGAKRDPITLRADDINSLLIDFTSELEKITKALDRI
jgi:predicted nucleotidyltransferase